LGSAAFDGYSPVGDILTIAICMVMGILLVFSFVRRTRSFRIFLAILGLLIFAAWTSVGYHTILEHWQPGLGTLAGVLRLLMHASLFLIFFLFVRYIANVTNLEHRKTLWATLAGGLISGTVILWDLIDTLNPGTGFRIGEDGAVQEAGGNIFLVGYLAYIVLLGILLIHVRGRLYKRVMYGFYGTVLMAILLNLLQRLAGQSSFTVGSFVLPVIAMFYIMHSSPYDVRLGAIDVHAMEDLVRFYREKKKDFGYMSLYMHTFKENHTEMSASLQATIRRFAGSYFRDARLFQIGSGHLLLVYNLKKNANTDSRIRSIMDAFQREYTRFRHDYKIVIGTSTEALSRNNDYISFIRYLYRRMPENSSHTVTDKDTEDFIRSEYILKQLTDIYRLRNPNDARVLVYCQPVFNIRLGRYDTAEALMRLKLPEIGLVYPDQFIPLAEENGYIHVLTEIILHKTCEAARRLLDAGYLFSRISVNVSALELKDRYFTRDITRIIESSSVSGEHVAIELTESQDESDFLIMQSRINELKGLGIKFYLDDFGTGYSSLERIMQLPFDIIKFDRSLVIASANSSRSEAIVRNMARLFAEMDFSVLYEGVEDDLDERRCIDMSASYLQGYKYSRPVPIEELTNFFSLSA